MIELLSYPFMVRALIAAAVTGLAAPTIGTYLVQRRLALLGDGLGHVAVTGVALGLLTGTSPTWFAVGRGDPRRRRDRGDPRARPHQRRRRPRAAVLRRPGRRRPDHRPGRPDRLDGCRSYLFGSVTSVSVADVVTTVVLAAVVVALCLGLLPQLFAVSQDQDFARVAGVQVRFYNLLVAVLAAVTVTVAMRTVGLLLVSALMVVPVATAQQLTRSFRSTMGVAMALGLGASLGGLLLAAYLSTVPLNVAPGPRSCCSR